MENLAFPGIFRVEDITLGGKTFKKVIVSQASAAELFDFFGKNYKAQSFLKNDINIKNWGRKILNDGNEDFTGGTVKDITRQRTDFSHLNQYQNALKKLPVWRKVKTDFSDISIKKRVRCQYDGEFDYDKKWDLEPFQRRGNSKTARKSVKLNVALTFSAYVNASTIDKYGAFASAIALLLEENGINVELNAFVGADGTYSKCTVGHDANIGFVKVKRSDEYLPTQNILQVFNSNFFRRVGFGIFTAGADSVGKAATDSLGTPLIMSRHWEFKQGEIFIYSVSAMNSQEQCLTEILDFIKKI